MAKEKKKQLSPISLRLTEDERRRVKQQAAGLTVSAYIRACLFDGDGKVSKRRSSTRKPVKDEKAIAQLLGILGQSRMANNLNQLAKAVNTGSLPLTPDVEQDIKKACSNISEMRVMLIKALGLRDGGQS